MGKEDKPRGYDDIIHLPHHQSARRPHMPVYERAAQFSPFAALTGYEEAIAEAGRVTEAFREMDEHEKEALDEMLRFLQENKESHLRIVISHFVPDEYKEGGAYLETEGRFLKLDPAGRRILIETGEDAEAQVSQIAVDQIAGIRLCQGTE